MNAVWYSEISFGRICLILLAKTFNKSLIEQLIELIGCKSPIYTAFGFLGIKAMKDEFAPAGIDPEL